MLKTPKTELVGDHLLTAASSPEEVQFFLLLFDRNVCWATTAENGKSLSSFHFETVDAFLNGYICKFQNSRKPKIGNPLRDSRSKA